MFKKMKNYAILFILTDTLVLKIQNFRDADGAGGGIVKADSVDKVDRKE